MIKTLKPLRYIIWEYAYNQPLPMHDDLFCDTYDELVPDAMGNMVGAMREDVLKWTKINA